MQSAEILYLSTKKYEYDDFITRALIQTAQSYVIELKEEIIDSVVRAECLFDKNKIVSKSGSAGGEAKAKRIEPLKIEVISRYLENYTDFSNKKAGAIIEAELINEKHELILLSKTEERNLQFAKWIGLFVKGQWKMPINN